MTGNNFTSRICWCGNTVLEYFSDDYSMCNQCCTLITKTALVDDTFFVKNDEESFYGKNYWLDHQRKDLNHPDIIQRARLDLPERCMHWLETLLKYKLPPAKVLEIGCAHGGFLGILQLMGYDVVGLELSDWVAEFAKSTFNIPVFKGPLEEQQFPSKTFDVIILMDVLEHLPDPRTTLKACLKVLKPEGFLLIQTPEYQEKKDLETIQKEQPEFLSMLIPDEHLYLFTRNSVQILFNELGIKYFYFEPAIFWQYDMFFIASREPIENNKQDFIDVVLQNSVQKRLLQALLDQRKTLQFIEKDSANKLKIIQEISTELARVSAELARVSAELASVLTENQALKKRYQYNIQKYLRCFFSFFQNIYKKITTRIR